MIFDTVMPEKNDTDDYIYNFIHHQTMIEIIIKLSASP